MSNIKDKRPRDKNNKGHGEWVGYFNNGQLRYCVNYVHGVFHGTHKTYQPNGSLKYGGNYNMGKMVGYWYWFTIKQYYLCLI